MNAESIRPGDAPVAAIFRHQLFLPSERFIHDQAAALRRFQPVFVTRDTIKNPVPGTESISLAQRAGRSDVMRYKILRRSEKLNHLVAGRAPKLIHAHFGVEGVYALGVAAHLDVPLITTFHGFDASITRLKLIATRRPSWVNYAAFRARLSRRGSLFVCASDHVRNKVVALGFPSDRVIRHYIGVDTSRFAPGTAGRAPSVLHVARLVDVKGTADLIRAFARLRSHHHDARLDIVGDGPLRASLTSLADELGLSSRVQFHGVRSHREVAEMMRRSQVFCLPSKRARSGAEEGLGMVLLEAAASGMPVVATHHGGIPEAVKDGTTGLLVDEGSPAQLAAALSALLRDNRLAEQIGKAARHRVEEHFDLVRQTARLEDIYESVL